jgi:cathepsin D
MNIGFTNSSLYTGSINYIPLVNAGTYWLVPLSNIKVAGASLSLSAPSVTIDTGTTLIGVPAAAAAAIYAAIPGSAPFQNQGLYTYPCAYVILQ